MSTQTRAKNLFALVVLSLVLLSYNLTQAPSVHAASASVVTIIHYENGKAVSTHIVSDAWYAFAIRAGYWGERLDELYHFCQQEANRNDPRCRHML